MIHHIIARAERSLGQPLDYLRDIAASSRTAFWKFLLFLPLARHRRHLPSDLWHAARITATRQADCGSCLQITVDQAIADGVAPGRVLSLLRGEEIDSVTRLIVDYVEAILDHRDSDAIPLRDEIVEVYGRDALPDLALAISTSQVFPLIKRSLGLSSTCSVVDVTIPPSR